MARHYESKREEIIASAENLLLARGFAGIKTDSVLKAAKVSQGGFFHHFKSIDDLIRALFARLIGEFNEGMQKAQANDSGSKGSFARAYIIASLKPRKTAEWQRAVALSRAWIEIALAKPNLMKEIFSDPQLLPDYYDLKMLSQLDPESAGMGLVLLMLAADGLWLNETLGIKAFKPAERERVIAALLRFSEIEYSDRVNTKQRKKST